MEIQVKLNKYEVERLANLIKDFELLDNLDLFGEVCEGFDLVETAKDIVSTIKVKVSLGDLDYAENYVKQGDNSCKTEIR